MSETISDELDEITQKLFNDAWGKAGLYSFDGTGTDTLTKDQAKQSILNLIDTKVNEARIDTAKSIHDNIAVRFNLIERIQYAYKGSKTIDVNDLQNLLCDYRDRLATLKSKENKDE